MKEQYIKQVEKELSLPRKMWFWPINHTELKRNKRLTQNPGWTYPE